MSMASLNVRTVGDLPDHHWWRCCRIARSPAIGEVLPGFTLPIKPLFDEMYQQFGARPPYQPE
jgi:hypothetical protein